ncbi:MAG: hypothetical protein Q9190_002282 [Brigantiaea leucoxantha]
MEQNRTRRRRDFDEKVKRNRDEERWRARSNQILREDFISQKRRWEEETARSAPDWVKSEDPSVNNQLRKPDSETGSQILEDFLAEEAEELKALVALTENSSYHFDNAVPNSPRSVTDDEDYDLLFLNLIAETDASQNKTIQVLDNCDEKMDLSTN